MVPAGGGNAEGWIAFRDALARIQAYTSPPAAGPDQVLHFYRGRACHQGLGSPRRAAALVTVSRPAQKLRFSAGSSAHR